MSNISPRKRWQAIHLHNYFPGMYLKEDIFRDWKTIEEGKACVFHKTTILRDPLDRFVASYKYNKNPLNQVDVIMRGHIMIQFKFTYVIFISLS